MFKAMDVEKIRKDFPILEREVHGKKLVYLDNAATTQKPRQVIDKLEEYYTKHNANIHRGVHQLSQEATEMYEEAHKKVGKFVNARHQFEETVFVRNATEAINMVTYGWAMHELKEGDEILSTVMEHHSNIVPWQLLREEGIKVDFVNVLEDGTLDMDDFENKLNSKTKLVTCVHASNVVGTINPVKKIGKIAHDNGALFLVDGAQSVPHMPVDVKDINCDFLAFSGHKMLAPTGTGALYAKKELLEKMHPFLAGGDMIREVKLEGSTWNDLPWKFEAGTPDIGGGIAFGAAVDYLKNIGMDNIRKHEIELIKYGLDRFSELDKVKIYGPTDPSIRAGLITFNLEKIHPHDVAGILDSEFGVAIRSGQHCAQPLTEHLGENSTCRASFYIYNTKEEVDVLIDGLKKVKEIFGK
jgi:cysteine desulfurase/selenocysteine lyase